MVIFFLMTFDVAGGLRKSLQRVCDIGLLMTDVTGKGFFFLSFFVLSSSFMLLVND